MADDHAHAPAAGPAPGPITVATPPGLTPATATTRRGLATASFCLGFWGTITFWWYPFGMMIASVGLVLGLVTLAMGVKAGKDGEPLGMLGVFFSATAIGLATAVYRFMQLAFEGSVPTSWP